MTLVKANEVRVSGSLECVVPETETAIHALETANVTAAQEGEIVAQHHTSHRRLEVAVSVFGCEKALEAMAVGVMLAATRVLLLLLLPLPP